MHTSVSPNGHLSRLPHEIAYTFYIHSVLKQLKREKKQTRNERRNISFVRANLSGRQKGKNIRQILNLAYTSRHITHLYILFYTQAKHLSHTCIT